MCLLPHESRKASARDAVMRSTVALPLQFPDVFLVL